jgi:hypothetical protein
MIVLWGENNDLKLVLNYTLLTLFEDFYNLNTVFKKQYYLIYEMETNNLRTEFTEFYDN